MLLCTCGSRPVVAGGGALAVVREWLLQETRAEIGLLRAISGPDFGPRSRFEPHGLVTFPTLEEVEVLVDVVVLLHIRGQELVFFGFWRLEDLLVELAFPQLLDERFQVLQVSDLIANVGLHVLQRFEDRAEVVLFGARDLLTLGRLRLLCRRVLFLSLIHLSQTEQQLHFLHFVVKSIQGVIVATFVHENPEDLVFQLLQLHPLFQDLRRLI